MIKDVFRIPIQQKEVGLEIEVEGHRLPNPPKGWTGHNDGSLRGESVEYVLRRPISRESVPKYLNRIKKAYNENETVIQNSDRTSTHVHINVQDMSITHIFNFIFLFLLYEEHLVKWCGDTRCGNLFCLRHQDAEYMIKVLEDIASGKQNFSCLDNRSGDSLRYAALNLKALATYGSLEFRSLRGTDDMDVINTWVNILLRLKDAAKKYEDPTHIIREISIHELTLFTVDLFQDNIDIILDYPDWEEACWDHLRQLQCLAYKGDWGIFSFNEQPEGDV